MVDMAGKAPWGFNHGVALYNSVAVHLRCSRDVR